MWRRSGCWESDNCLFLCSIMADVLNIIGDMITFDVQLTNFGQGFYVLCGCEVGTKHGTVNTKKCRVEYPDVAKFARRAGRTAIAPVLKTGVRKDLGVRIPRSPLRKIPPLAGFPFRQLLAEMKTTVKTGFRISGNLPPFL